MKKRVIKITEKNVIVEIEKDNGEKVLFEVPRGEIKGNGCEVRR